MMCKACPRFIEDQAMDELLELCNKCYSVSMESLDELLDEDQQLLRDQFNDED